MMAAVPPNLALAVEAARQSKDTGPLFDLAARALEAGRARAAADACRAAFDVDQTPGPLRAWLHGGAIGEQAPAIALERARALVAGGFTTSTMLAELAVAAALAGSDAAVRALMDVPRFLWMGALASAAAEHAVPSESDLADAIGRRAQFVASRPGRGAIRNAWRTGSIHEDADTPALRALFAAVRGAVDRYIARLPDEADHPYLANKPRAYRLSGWGVVSGVAGHHATHVHHRAWATCVYYVSVPEAVAGAQQRLGWLHVGPPGDVPASAQRGWDDRWIQPYRDLLLIMPGYFHHDTRPPLTEDARICVAVDVIQADR
jgi:hypothetical protein